MTCNIRNLDNIVEEDEPPSNPLDRLNSYFIDLFKNHSDIYIARNNYDYSIAICLRRPFKKFVYEMFRVYTDGEVADNSKYISSAKVNCSEYVSFVKNILKDIGYSSFHNPYVAYLDKRFDEALNNSIK